MKLSYYAVILLLGMSMILSCGSKKQSVKQQSDASSISNQVTDNNNWMEGYWGAKNDDGRYYYLKVEDGKIVMLSEESDTIRDFDGVNRLFETKKADIWDIHEIGNAIKTGDDSREEIGISDINDVSYKRLIYLSESGWDILKKQLIENSGLTSKRFQFVSMVQEGVAESFIFSNPDNKVLIYVDVDVAYDEPGPTMLFKKIDK